MHYDLAIIGAGWAGFNAALRAKELGLKVALIEKDSLGGTCLNRGCIPTKTLIHSAKIYNLTRKSSLFGVEIASSPQINWVKIQERKDKLIQQLRSNMQFMLGGIDLYNCPAQVLSNEKLKAGTQEIKSRFILIATGSRPMELKDLKFDSKKTISSDEILSLKEVPRSLLIIGGGVIGCEFAGLFSALGASVSIIEKMPQLLPGEDKEIARRLENFFKKKGIKVSTDTDAHTVDLKDYALILLCVGRQPNIEGMSLEKIGLVLEKSRIIVDEYLKTNIANIYAAGDCTAKTMLAHFAAHQGRTAAENIVFTDKPKMIDDTGIPNCIFTEPQIASVGLNEEEAKNKGLDIEINRFDFKGSGMARILDEAEGFIKIISDNKTGQVMGASIIGPAAAEIIGILTLAVSCRLKISQIRDTIFAHPTLSESIHDAIK